MSAAEVFFDSNVILYLTSSDTAKAQHAETLLGEGGVISVQVLNECASVARRKFAMKWNEVHELLRAIRIACRVEPVSLETHERGLEIAEKFGYGIHDSMIVAAALGADCTTLFSEDMQHRQRIGRLTIRNPFAEL
jgi:predicted nucleic acid-binding protein